MKIINFAGYVKINKHYINADKVAYITESYNPNEDCCTPTLVNMQNGRNIEIKDLPNAQKLTNLLIKAQNVDAILDYEA